MRKFLVCMIALGLGAGLTIAQSEKPAEPEYLDAPDFTLLDVDGDEYTLSEILEDGPVYMECWDLPCVNCIAELDALMPFYDSLEARGLTLIALSVDKPADEAKVRNFVASKNWPYLVLLDQDKEVYKAYGIVFKPTAFLINTDGKIVYTHMAYKKGDEERIVAEIEKLLPAAEETAPADSVDGEDSEE